MRKIKRLIKKFGSWLDYNPPGSLSSKGWRLFNLEFKTNAPVRNWLTHDLRRKFYLPVKWKYERASRWVRYRTVNKYHIIDTGLPPDYYDTDTLMLHGNFNLLKNFVEVEQAWQKYCWSQDHKNSKNWVEKHLPKLYRLFSPFRRPDLGVQHFEWAATLDDPNLPPFERSDQQAQDAREILSLYNWWVNIRPARQEIPSIEYNNQGLGILGALDDDFNHDADDYKKNREIAEHNSKLDELWKEEDDAMLLRLIKIRRGLWT